MARDGSCLARDALHHVAVAAQRVDVVVEQLEAGPIEMLGQPARADRHADARGGTLAQGPGSGLHAGGHPVLGVPGTGAVELPEALDVVERHRGAALDRPPAHRPGAARNKAASKRAHRTARTGRDWAIPDRPGRSAESPAIACRRPGPAPWECPDGPNSPSAPRPSTGCESCRCTAGQVRDHPAGSSGRQSSG